MPVNPLQSCYCGNSQPFKQCCQPFINFETVPKTPEQLMRSRFSAFATANVDYIFKTQDPTIHQSLDKQSFLKELQGQKWVHLEVVNTTQDSVEFIASMLYNDILYTMQELSLFEQKEQRWIYAKALEHKASERAVLRNETCPCGSGKKYKKCCQKA